MGQIPRSTERISSYDMELKISISEWYSYVFAYDVQVLKIVTFRFSQRNVSVVIIKVRQNNNNSQPSCISSPCVCHFERRRKFRTTVSFRWSGVVVSTLALINEVNIRCTRLVLRWVTVSGSIPGAGHLFQYVTNQPPRPTQHSIPPGSVNEYQLQLGRQRQVWFIPIADERGVAGCALCR